MGVAGHKRVRQALSGGTLQMIVVLTVSYSFLTFRLHKHNVKSKKNYANPLPQTRPQAPQQWAGSGTPARTVHAIAIQPQQAVGSMVAVP